MVAPLEQVGRRAHRRSFAVVIIRLWVEGIRQRVVALDLYDELAVVAAARP